MKTFRVTISSRLVATGLVEAESAEQARAIVEAEVPDWDMEPDETEVLSVEECEEECQGAETPPPASGPVQEQGRCPVCGSDDLEYSSMTFVDGQLAWEFTCEKCGTAGKEWFALKYEESIPAGGKSKELA